MGAREPIVITVFGHLSRNGLEGYPLDRVVDTQAAYRICPTDKGMVLLPAMKYYEEEVYSYDVVRLMGVKTIIFNN